VKPLLDPNTAHKIRVITKYHEILPALRQEIDDDVIPQEYGGKGVSSWYDSAEEEQIFALAAQVNKDV